MSHCCFPNPYHRAQEVGTFLPVLNLGKTESMSKHYATLISFVFEMQISNTTNTALLVVPPAQPVDLLPPAICQGIESAFTVTGSFFVRIFGNNPTVNVNSAWKIPSSQGFFFFEYFPQFIDLSLFTTTLNQFRQIWFNVWICLLRFRIVPHLDFKSFPTKPTTSIYFLEPIFPSLCHPQFRIAMTPWLWLTQSNWLCSRCHRSLIPNQLQFAWLKVPSRFGWLDQTFCKSTDISPMSFWTRVSRSTSPTSLLASSIQSTATTLANAKCFKWPCLPKTQPHLERQLSLCHPTRWEPAQM